ncbi:transporter [Clostridium sp. CAG:411]|jgi:NSS family neurotransmitter:Na+ symporter|nr:sodium-dependent transporter [Lachnospiraceae bacterium]CDE42712.1 transporter [Clostridium sp. CAG:411]
MKKRETFGSRLGFILVSAGCAVGLGNVWKFPYICGQYGGAAFILVYLLFLLILGLPILMCEFAIGRNSRKGISNAFDELQPKGEKWHTFKWAGMAGNYLLMMFYTMVGGWMLYYVYLSATGKLMKLDTDGVTKCFEQMLQQPETMIFWTILVVLISFGICAFGLEGGVERISKIIMTMLLLLMLVLAVHSLVLKGAGEGVRFYLIPDFTRIQKNGVGKMVFAAMSHAFFTLGLGVGSMEIFGSYLDKKNTLLGEAGNIVIVDTLVALTAGFIIIPACFSFGIEPNSGPPLLFITLPNVFNSMEGGRIWGTMFFLFMSFAAISTIVAVYENILSFYMDGLKWKRQKAIGLNIVLLVLLSLPAILGYNVLSHIQILGEGTNLMDLEDFLVSYNILPLGCLIFVTFCTHKNGWGWEQFYKEVNIGEGKKLPACLRVYMSYILPLIIMGIYLKGYFDYFADPEKYTMAVRVAWMGFAVLLLLVTLGIIYGTFTKKGKAKK